MFNFQIFILKLLIVIAYNAHNLNLNASDSVVHEYEVAIGLGPNCAAKSALNQYCKRKTHSEEAELTQTEKQIFPSCPFDWMSIFDYQKLIDNLHTNFGNFFQRESLELLEHPYGGEMYKSAYDRDNKMLWNHLFSKPDGHITTPEIFESEYEEKKQKIEHLFQNFCSAKDKKTLYVMVTNYVDIPKLSQLADALEGYRENNNFTLLCFNAQNIEVTRNNLRIRALKSVDFSNMDMNKFCDVIDAEFPLKLSSLM